jgi:hypothetical protein
VKSHTTERFRKAFSKLPKQTQQQARIAYKQFKKNPYHSSLQFKRVHASKPICSVRVSLGYRALGVKSDEDVVWFWVGSHADYDRLISSL